MRSHDDSALELFLSESEENLRSLESLLDAASSEQNRKTTQQSVAEAFRLVHTLKGASALMRYGALERSAHLLEDILAALRSDGSAPPDGDSALPDVCFSFADHFSEQLERIRGGEEPVSSDELDAALARAAASLRVRPAPVAEATPAPAAPSPQTPPDGIPRRRRLRQCPMPHVRLSVVMRSVEALCDSVRMVPRDIGLHPELAERILENGWEIYVAPKPGVDPTRITERLAKQPFVSSVIASGPRETAQGAKRRENAVRVPQSRLNELIAMLDETVTTQSMLAEVLEAAGLSDSRVEHLMGRLRHDAAQARDLCGEMGMVEIGPVFAQMRRLVRTMAQESGENIAFVSEGDGVRIDGNMVEAISDALLHIVRNAVDHGIEPSDSRLRAQKTAEGTVSLSAKKENGLLVLTVADDGRGIDREAVLEKAFARGLIPRRMQTCSDGELLEILSSAGFSTKADVSRYSGRGVGLDTAVRRVRDMQGSISLKSAEGRGSQFILRIPTTLSLLNALALRIGEDRVLLPSADVASVCFAERAEERGGKVAFGGQEYERLPLPAAACDSEGDSLVFLAPEYGRRYIRATRTDLVGEMLLLPLPRYVSDMLGKGNLFSGCCVGKDDAILCVLDPYRLISTNDTRLEGRNRDEDI